MEEDYTLLPEMTKFKAAVRWLFDAKRFKADFSSDGWQGADANLLGEVSEVTYTDAVRDVINCRKRLEKRIKDTK